MADQDPDALQKLSLDKPKLFGRRRSRGDADTEQPAPAPEPAAESTAEPAPESVPEPAPEPVPVPATVPGAGHATEPPSEPSAGRVSRLAALALSGYQASAVVGLLVGVLLVALSLASIGTCSAVSGTATCGKNLGIVLLLAILVALAALGGLLLRRLGVEAGLSASVLAVGVTAVVALLVLVPWLFSWAMVVVVPLLSVGAYLLAHWISTVAGDDGPDPEVYEAWRRERAQAAATAPREDARQG